MEREYKLILDSLIAKPDQSAGQIWNKFMLEMETNSAVKKLYQTLYPEKDQTIRELLAKLENDNKVKHRIKFRSILKEWRLV